MRSTGTLGGRDVTPDELRLMQAGDFILHVRGGELREIPVRKARMPRDPAAHYQGLALIRAPGGAIYAFQRTIVSKSTDRGETWEHLRRDPERHGFSGWSVQFNQEGSLLAVSQESREIRASDDEGASWSRFGRIDAAPFGKVLPGDNMTRLSDGTLLLPVKQQDEDFHGKNPAWVFRSTDGGRSFPERFFLSDYGCEVNLTELSPGRLIAAIRHQPGPPDRPETGKRLFLADSGDGGATWSNHRQLTSVLGQCHGMAAGLSNGRVVVAHDHRYPRDMGSCRAMVSRDRGLSWEDEVYYLCHGNSAGYPRHLTLDSDEILTFVGSCYGDVDAGWDTATGNSDFCLIRWRPV